MSGRNKAGLVGLAEKETSKEVSKDNRFWVGALILAVILCYNLPNLGITFSDLGITFTNDTLIFILFMSFYMFAYSFIPFLDKKLKSMELKDIIINLFLLFAILSGIGNLIF